MSVYDNDPRVVMGTGIHVVDGRWLLVLHEDGLWYVHEMLAEEGSDHEPVSWLNSAMHEDALLVQLIGAPQ